jgi:putative ABC transport system permease protein
MFDRDLWHEIIEALKKNKMRTLLTAFGVFWGILMLIIMLGAGRGLRNGAFHGLGEFATNSFFVWNQRTSVPYKGLPTGRWISFTNADVRYLRDNVPEIDLLGPSCYVEFWRGEGLSNAIHGLKQGAFEITGEYPAVNKIDPRDIYEGRFVNYYDLLQTRKVVVIGQSVVASLFDKNEDPLGQYIKVRGTYLLVVGVFRSKHSGGWGDQQNKGIILPFTTMQQLYNYGDKVHNFAITAKKGIPASLVEEKVKSILKERHDVAPEDVQAVASFNLEKQVAQFTMLFFAINIFVWFVGICTLLAGIIGVSNIMLVIIRERTKEIGIQRAIGASPFQIIRQIVLESVYLTTIAGYTGLVLGVALVEGANYLMNKAGVNAEMFYKPEINFGVAVAALTVLIFAGVIAGLIPAMRAIKVKTVEALRFEN